MGSRNQKEWSCALPRVRVVDASFVEAKMLIMSTDFVTVRSVPRRSAALGYGIKGLLGFVS